MTTNRGLNLVYGATLVVALIVLIVVGFGQGDALGYYTWMSVSILGGVLVLWRKRRLNTWWVWLLFALSVGLGFPIAVLCLRAREQETGNTRRIL